MFCHWDHGQGDVDVDASVIFYDENFNYILQLPIMKCKIDMEFIQGM